MDMVSFNSGPFLPPSPVNPPATGQSVVVDDLDGDGYPDLIIAFGSYNPNHTYLQVLMNNGDFTFRDETLVRMTQVGASFGEVRGITWQRPMAAGTDCSC